MGTNRGGVLRSGGGSGSGSSCDIVKTGTPKMPPTGTYLSACDFYQAHFQNTPPSVSIRGTPSFGLYEIGYSIVNPQIEGRGTLGQSPVGTLTNMEFFRGSVGSISIGTVANPTPSTWVDPTDTFTVTTNQTYSVRLTDSEGRTATASGNYIFVYPWFATTNTITTLTKQALQNGGSYYQVTMVAETATDKQMADFETPGLTITGIEVFDTNSGSWKWLNGSKAGSLTVFNTSAVTHTVQGNVVNYTRFTHNGTQTGLRDLRFHTD